MEPINIVMTTWNREEFTRRSIKSIQDNTKYPYRLIIIDNGSDSKEFRDWLSKTCSEGVFLDKNYGLEYAKNKGMELVTSELFVSTDNDILAPKPKDGKDWLGTLVGLMDRNVEYAAISCRPQVLIGTGNIFDESKEITDFTHVPGYLRIMRTALVKEAGAWSDKRPLRGHEEFWISEKLRAMGHKVGWANHVKVFHLFGENEDWGYTGLKPEEHGHNPVGGIPPDSSFDLSDYE